MNDTSDQPVKHLSGEVRALSRLALPLVGHNLANIAMNTTDAVMAGRLSAGDLASIAIGGAVWITLILFGLGVMMTISPLVAHAYGAKRFTEIGDYVRQGLWVALTVGALIFMLTRSAEPVLAGVGVDPVLWPKILGYLDALSWCAPAWMTYLLLRFTSEGSGHMKPVLAVAIIGAMINVPMNHLFMYGGLGIPAMGAVGCGWATTVVQFVMLASIFSYLRTSSVFRPFEIWTGLEWPRLDRQLEILRLGLPIGIMVLMEGGMFGAASLMMGKLGVTIAAAHQIALNVASVVFMVPLGLSLAITVRVGHALGRGEPDAARHSGNVGVGATGVFAFVWAGLLVLIAEPVAALYTLDPDVRTLAVSLLYLAAFFQLSDGLQVAFAGALRGFKDTRVPMIITVIAYWVIGVPMAWYLSIERALGPHTVWYGLLAGLTFAAVMLGARYWRVSHRSTWPGPPAPEPLADPEEVFD